MVPKDLVLSVETSATALCQKISKHMVYISFPPADPKMANDEKKKKKRQHESLRFVGRSFGAKGKLVKNSTLISLNTDEVNLCMLHA